MRWRGREQSENVEDRRAMGGPRMAGGGIGILVIALIVWLLGGNPMAVLKQGGGIQIGQGGGAQQPLDPADEPLKEMAGVVLNDTETVWDDVFQRQLGKKYQPTKMILFRDGVQSGCGTAGSETGPFYCPADGNVYLDLSFFRELEDKFGAAGDFAQAYVIAHEVGHHVRPEGRCG